MCLDQVVLNHNNYLIAQKCSYLLVDTTECNQCNYYGNTSNVY